MGKGVFDSLRCEIESDIEHFRKTFNLPERRVYKYEDGSGARGYIITEGPIVNEGAGKPLNVCVFGDGGGSASK
jgi:hypothetical protein